jgi:hypothetical protein
MSSDNRSADLASAAKLAIRKSTRAGISQTLKPAPDALESRMPVFSLDVSELRLELTEEV